MSLRCTPLPTLEIYQRDPQRTSINIPVAGTSVMTKDKWKFNVEEACNDWGRRRVMTSFT